MIDTLDRLLIAPILGVAGYFLHSALYSTIFIWFAPQVKGEAFWLSLVTAQITVAVLVAAVAALPLAYVYRSRAVVAGLVTGVVAAGIYGVVMLTGSARSNLNVSLDLLKISWLIVVMPILALYASRSMLPLIEMKLGSRRTNG